jgi:hypothetical protein
MAISGDLERMSSLLRLTFLMAEGACVVACSNRSRGPGRFRLPNKILRMPEPQNAALLNIDVGKCAPAAIERSRRTEHAEDSEFAPTPFSPTRTRSSPRAARTTDPERPLFVVTEAIEITLGPHPLAPLAPSNHLSALGHFGEVPLRLTVCRLGHVAILLDRL